MICRKCDSTGFGPPVRKFRGWYCECQTCGFWENARHAFVRPGDKAVDKQSKAPDKPARSNA